MPKVKIPAPTHTIQVLSIAFSTLDMVSSSNLFIDGLHRNDGREGICVLLLGEFQRL